MTVLSPVVRPAAELLLLCVAELAAVALDALLAGHPDPDMRSRAHAAFVRKSERRRSLDASGEGDEQ